MKRVFLYALLLLAFTGVAEAQYGRGRLDLTPYAGVLVPTHDVVEAGAVATGAPAAAHEVNFLVGGKLTYWFAEEIGLEADVAFAPNALESEAFGIPGTVDARFLFVDVRIVQAFQRAAGKPTLLLSGGIGLVGTSYDQLDMTAGGLGVLGIGVRLPLGSVSLQIEAEDYISTTRWELRDGSKTDKALQNDLRFSAGLSFPLRR